MLETLKQKTINIYWKLRRTYWKAKPVFRKTRYVFQDFYHEAKWGFEKNAVQPSQKLIGNSRGALIRGYWGAKSGAVDPAKIYSIKSYWFLRQIIVDSFFRAKGFGIDIYWFLQRRLVQLRQLQVFLKLTSGDMVLAYWKFRNSVFCYPFVKVYWFCNYQINKRIRPLLIRK